MNKYYQTLANIIANGHRQTNKKGEIVYLLNQQLDLRPVICLTSSRDTTSPGRNYATNCNYSCRANA